MAYNYIVETGTIIPDASAIRSEVEAEWRDIAGEDATIDPSSFEGRLIDALVTERINIARYNADEANGLNPNRASGVRLDNHLELIGSKRDSAERSTCECLLTGVSGTIVPSGSYAQDDSKRLWELVDDATIGLDNQVTASFRSVDFGEIQAAIGEINKIVSGVVGWETVINEAPASVGKLEQNDVSARRQRRIELGANSRSVAESVIAAVSKLEGVNGVKFLENFKNFDQTIENVFLIEKSSWLCVDGGVNSEIADAYYRNRWGTDFNGLVEVDYEVPSNGHSVIVKFDRPTDKPLKARITARVNQSLDAVSDIKKAVVNYANGQVDNEKGFSLGEDASPFEVGSGVNVQLSDVFIVNCELAEIGGAFSNATIVNEIYEKASITESDVEVVIV